MVRFLFYWGPFQGYEPNEGEQDSRSRNIYARKGAYRDAIKLGDLIKNH